jgi:hypothetical protein
MTSEAVMAIEMHCTRCGEIKMLRYPIDKRGNLTVLRRMLTDGHTGPIRWRLEDV